MARLPTVKIFDPGKPDDFLIINESDYDPATMRIWDPDVLLKSRQERIEDAVRKLPADTPSFWTRDGAPNVKALETLLGFNINANERDVAWEAVQAERERAAKLAAEAAKGAGDPGADAGDGAEGAGDTSAAPEGDDEAAT